MGVGRQRPRETEGGVVGYNTLNGDNYGGSDGPLPPGAHAAFLLAKGGWQAAPTSRAPKRCTRNSLMCEKCVWVPQAKFFDDL